MRRELNYGRSRRTFRNVVLDRYGPRAPQPPPPPPPSPPSPSPPPPAMQPATPHNVAIPPSTFTTTTTTTTTTEAPTTTGELLRDDIATVPTGEQATHVV